MLLLYLNFGQNTLAANGRSMKEQRSDETARAGESPDAYVPINKPSAGQL